MALLVCTGCTTRYSVGAARCPQCSSTNHVEEGAEDMAKIRVHGGVSDANAVPEPETGEDVPPEGGAEAPSEETEVSAEPEKAAPRQRKPRSRT